MSFWSNISPGGVVSALALSALPALGTAAVSEYSHYPSIDIYESGGYLSVSSKSVSGYLMYATNSDASSNMTLDKLMSRAQKEIDFWKSNNDDSAFDRCHAYSQGMNLIIGSADVPDGTKIIDINIADEMMKSILAKGASKDSPTVRSLERVSHEARKAVWADRGFNDFAPWISLALFLSGFGLTLFSSSAFRKASEYRGRGLAAFGGFVLCIAAGFYPVYHVDGKAKVHAPLLTESDTCEMALANPFEDATKKPLSRFFENLKFWAGMTENQQDPSINTNAAAQP